VRCVKAISRYQPFPSCVESNERRRALLPPTLPPLYLPTWMNDDFPQPVRPTMPTRAPPGMENVRSFRTRGRPYGREGGKEGKEEEKEESAKRLAAIVK